MQLLIRVNLKFVMTGGQIYLTKTVSFQNTKITQQSKIKENKVEMKGTSIYLKLPMKGLLMRKICLFEYAHYSK